MGEREREGEGWRVGEGGMKRREIQRDKEFKYGGSWAKALRLRVVNRDAKSRE